MALQQIDIKVIKGMNQDASAQVFDSQTAFYLLNMKNQVINSNNQNALTNEKGTEHITIKGIDHNTNKTQDITGNIIGVVQCTPNTAVLFLRQRQSIVTDYIYRVDYNNGLLVGKLLATDDSSYYTDDIKTNTNILIDKNFDFGNYISGIFCYENDKLQKVYWVDGKNVMRYINIVNDNIIFDANELSCNPKFKLDHHMTVKRISGNSIFSPGVIQYCFTYFRKHGPETGVVDISPMYYISEDDKGVAADKTVSCSFEVSIQNPDTSYDYIRLYSIQRTALNGPAIVKLVKDIKLK